MNVFHVARLAIVPMLASLVSADDRDWQQKLESRVRRETTRLTKLSAGTVIDERARLHKDASALLAAANESKTNRYRADRLLEAARDLLEASENLHELSTPPRREDDDEAEERERTARRLERAYFRLQQADYFARQSNYAGSKELILSGRRHYQKARAAYDERQYWQSSKLASVCFDIVGALEKLAQAQIRVPDPPRLP